jgi:uncharacterized protein
MIYERKEDIIMRGSRFSVMLICLGFVLFLVPFGSGHAKPVRLRVATATMGGTWYPIGVGFANLITDKLKGEGITMTAQSSAGSVENINMLREKETDLAMLIGFLGKMAWDGMGQFQGKSFKGFRSMIAMQTNLRHDVILTDKARTGTFTDLNGLHYNVGAAGSGAEQTIGIILNALNIKIRPEHLGYSQAVEAIKDRRIDGGTFAAVPPVPGVTELFNSPTKVSLLSFTQQQLDQINATLNAWIMLTIPANTYPKQIQPIQTLGEPIFVACRADLEEEIVYKILKTLYANMDEMAKVHAQGRTFFQKTEGLPVPLHPGAIRYWKEQGLTIPAHLTQ